MQQLRFDVLAAAQADTQQRVFPSELLAATDAQSKPLTRAERAKAAQAKSMEPVAATAPEPRLVCPQPHLTPHPPPELRGLGRKADAPSAGLRSGGSIDQIQRSDAAKGG